MSWNIEVDDRLGTGPASHIDEFYGKSDLLHIDVDLLRTCRQVFDEAESRLYASHHFDFRVEPSCIVPFLQSLSHRGRQSIQSITLQYILYRPSWSDQVRNQFELDSDGWNLGCTYISENLRLREVNFDVSLEGLRTDFKDDTWVQNMIKIKGLQRLSQFGGCPTSCQDFWPKDGCPHVGISNAFNQLLVALLKYFKSEMVVGYKPDASEESWKFQDRACGRSKKRHEVN